MKPVAPTFYFEGRSTSGLKQFPLPVENQKPLYHICEQRINKREFLPFWRQTVLDQERMVSMHFMLEDQFILLAPGST